MRTFASYGPIELHNHFGVPRTELVQRCLRHIIGNVETGGHYFTIWAPRQTGKTWVMQQVIQEVSRQYGDQFAVQKLSFGRLFRSKHLAIEEPEDTYFLKRLSRLIKQDIPGKPDVKSWDDFYDLFLKDTGLWDRPLLLLIDEVDALPSTLLDMLARYFRELYLSRENNWLHGLALIGVRAVIGIESQRGSPFNVQRSFHIPNLTADEVRDMYQQYQDETGQPIDPEIVEQVYRTTLGQPGLVSWLGELMTQNYNPTPPYPWLARSNIPLQPITDKTWRIARMKAEHKEPNNFVINLNAKARDPEYQPFLATLFSQPDVPFSFHQPMHNYMYMHGIITSEMVEQPDGDIVEMCRFASPFVQECLYHILSEELLITPVKDLVVATKNLKDEVLVGNQLLIPVLLNHYQNYLDRLYKAGINPWKDQPRRSTDLHLTEAVGHFHLYAWLSYALQKLCVVSPEFPTGNGKVDIHLRCGDIRGLIEVKSFVNFQQVEESRIQASHYAQQTKLDRVTLVVFIEIQDKTAQQQLSGVEMIDGIEVTTMMVGWGHGE